MGRWQPSSASPWSWVWCRCYEERSPAGELGGCRSDPFREQGLETGTTRGPFQPEFPCNAAGVLGFCSRFSKRDLSGDFPKAVRKHCVGHLLFFILGISGRRVPRILKLVACCSPWYLGLCLSCPEGGCSSAGQSRGAPCGWLCPSAVLLEPPAPETVLFSRPVGAAGIPKIAWACAQHLPVVTLCHLWTLSAAVARTDRAGRPPQPVSQPLNHHELLGLVGQALGHGSTPGARPRVWGWFLRPTAGFKEVFCAPGVMRVPRRACPRCQPHWAMWAPPHHPSHKPCPGLKECIQ